MESHNSSEVTSVEEDTLLLDDQSSWDTKGCSEWDEENEDTRSELKFDAGKPRQQFLM